MHYVKQFNINGVDTKQVACIELQGKPNAATVGAVGLLGIDMLSPTHEVYKCIAVNGSIYTWELMSNGLSTIASTISGNGENSVQFPYNTLKIPSGYVIKVGDLIIDSLGYEYQVTAIDATSCSATYCGMAFTQGQPGLTPHIGENGNWWVGDTDTGVMAQLQYPYAYGSYVGTKISGKPYPNSLTFPFIPKLVIIMGEHTNDQMILINGVKYGISYYSEFNYNTFECYKNFTDYKDIVTQWDGNTLHWYYDGYKIDTDGEPYYGDIESANRQLNGAYCEIEWFETDPETGKGHYSLVTPNETYHYIAIG